MTYKYLDVRREIYEKNPSNMMNSYRSFLDIKKLYKRSFWILLGIFLISLVCLVVVTMFALNGLLELLFTIPPIVVLLLLEIPREKYFYNESARLNELSEIKQNYNEYVLKVCTILKSQGVDTPDKLLCLKNECSENLKKHENTFEKLNSKLVDMFIGVPLGALIASVIYSDSKAVPIAIWVVVFIGIAVLGILKFISIINYYSEGYFKDKYLLDILNELNYFDNFFIKNNRR